MKKLTLLFVIAFIAGAQTPPATPGHAGSRLVLVDVLVRNKAGAVSGLTKDDFTLTDKGKPQTIEVFATTAGRDANAAQSPLSPAVGANRLTRRGDAVRSATVILYDRLNTPAADQAFVRRQVLETLRALKDTDVFGFYSLGKSLSVVHDFTGDPAPMIRAATRLTAVPPQAAPNDLVEQTAQKALEDALLPQQDMENVFRVATTARAFQSIARHLSGLAGRKNVAWITRTFPLTFGSDFNRRGELDTEINATTVTLQEENIALYPISPGGVGSGFGDKVTPDRPVEGRLMPGSNASIAEDSGTLSDNSTLGSIASATGGVAYYSINDVTPAVREVMRDTDISYTLGYYPENKTLDGKFHDFGVRVKTPGAALRFRKRYFASKEDPRRQTPPIPALAADPLEATAIQVAAYAQPDAARPGYQKVSVSVNVNDLKLNHEGDRWSGAFEMALSLNGAMSAAGEQKIFNLNFTDQQLHQAQTSGMIVEGAVNTRNEAVVVRAIVRDKNSGAAGVVTVPPMAKP
jgi:VWFA-related protein